MERGGPSPNHKSINCTYLHHLHAESDARCCQIRCICLRRSRGVREIIITFRARMSVVVGFSYFSPPSLSASCRQQSKVLTPLLFVFFFLGEGENTFARRKTAFCAQKEDNESLTSLCPRVRLAGCKFTRKVLSRIQY